MNKLTIQEAVLLGALILGVAFWGTQYSKGKSIERQQAQEIAEERRIADAEKKAKDARTYSLALCVDSAEDVYWNYIKLNGTDMGDGNWNAYTWQWDEAQQRKDKKLDECYKLYK